MKPKPRRRTSKTLTFGTVAACFGVWVYALAYVPDAAGSVSAAMTVIIPAVVGAYMGIGAVDMRTAAQAQQAAPTTADDDGDTPKAPAGAAG